MTTRCPYCGRELQCIGGFYGPKFEECNCGGKEKAWEASRRRCEELEHKCATCQHEWHYGVQDNVAYKYCPKCGDMRPR